MHRSGTGSATPTSGGKGDSSSSNLGDLESSDKSSVGSQDDKAHAALNMGEFQIPRELLIGSCSADSRVMSCSYLSSVHTDAITFF